MVKFEHHLKFKMYLGMVEMFYILTGWYLHRCTHLSKLKLYASNGCTLLYVNYTILTINKLFP